MTTTIARDRNASQTGSATAERLVADLRRRGVRIWRDGDAFVVFPPQRIPTWFWTAIRHHHAAILEVLRQSESELNT